MLNILNVAVLPIPATDGLESDKISFCLYPIPRFMIVKFITLPPAPTITSTFAPVPNPPVSDLFEYDPVVKSLYRYL